MKFDPAAEWDKLSPPQQRAIGIAGLTLEIATEAVELIDDEAAALAFGDPRRVRLIALDKAWEAAEQRAWTLLDEAVPQDADLFDEGPVDA